MKRTIFAVSILTLLVAAWAWSHCHDTLVCEDLDGDVIGPNSWTPGTNVKYRVNNTVYQDKPLLANDCRDAGYRWSSIYIDGHRVRITFSRIGITPKVAKSTADRTNVISYGPLPWNNNTRTAAICYLFTDDDPGVFSEIDMLFNYYAPYEIHNVAVTAPGYVCIRHIATHEFGHWVGLLDISKDTCEEYEHYTMLEGQFGETNQHWRFSLSCEDKHAAYLIYGNGQD